jgi:hypothetical protein
METALAKPINSVQGSILIAFHPIPWVVQWVRIQTILKVVPSPVGVAIIVLALPVIALEAVRLLLE